jgi:dynein heavy chain
LKTVAKNFADELRRKVYITPKSYLDSIKMYKRCYDEKKAELGDTIQRLSNGLHKLSSTSQQVADLQKMLTELEPELKTQKLSASTKAIAIGNESKLATEKEKLVEEEEKVVGEQAMEIKVVKEKVEKQLDEAKPIMEKAQSALLVLNDEDIVEIKTMPRPPKVVEMTMEAVLIYLKYQKTDWAAARSCMGDSKFKEKLTTYEVDSIPESLLRKVRKIINKKEFDPVEIGKKAKAAE